MTICYEQPHVENKSEVLEKTLINTMKLSVRQNSYANHTQKTSHEEEKTCLAKISAKPISLAYIWKLMFGDNIFSAILNSYYMKIYVSSVLNKWGQCTAKYFSSQL